jgi:hypothetical protein
MGYMTQGCLKSEEFQLHMPNFGGDWVRQAVQPLVTPND